jgi:DNA-binding NarL/FixJ family response regulator
MCLAFCVERIFLRDKERTLLPKYVIYSIEVDIQSERRVSTVGQRRHSPYHLSQCSTNGGRLHLRTFRRIAMTKDILALLVFAESDSSQTLQRALQRQSVRTMRVRTCNEARQFMERETRPDIIFSDVSVADGTWADVLKMARKERTPAEVVVVSRLPNTKLYIEVMERGGFDFMAPPFAQADLAHVVESATVEASKRWGAQLRASTASA